MFSQTNNSLQGLLVLFNAVSAPGSDVTHQDALNEAGLEIPQYLRGFPEFSSDVYALFLSPLSQHAAPRSDPR